MFVLVLVCCCAAALFVLGAVLKAVAFLVITAMLTVVVPGALAWWGIAEGLEFRADYERQITEQRARYRGTRRATPSACRRCTTTATDHPPARDTHRLPDEHRLRRALHRGQTTAPPPRDRVPGSAPEAGRQRGARSRPATPHRWRSGEHRDHPAADQQEQQREREPDRDEDRDPPPCGEPTHRVRTRSAPARRPPTIWSARSRRRYVPTTSPTTAHVTVNGTMLRAATSATGPMRAIGGRPPRTRLRHRVGERERRPGPRLAASRRGTVGDRGGSGHDPYPPRCQARATHGPAVPRLPPCVERNDIA